MLLSEQSGSSCESSNCRACVCRHVCLVMFSEGLKPSHLVSLWICTYLPWEPSQPHVPVVSCICRARRIVMWHPWCSSFGDCKVAMPGVGEGSISNTPHKSMRVTSTEVTVFVTDNHNMWQLLRHSSSQKRGTSENVLVAKYFCWRSQEEAASVECLPHVALIIHLLVLLLSFRQLGQDLVLWSQCDPFVICPLRACGVCG